MSAFEHVCKMSLFVLLGKKDKLRVYYLSWLRNKILHNDPEVEKKQGWTTVGDLEGCVHYKVGESSSQRVCLPRVQFVFYSKFTCSLKPLIMSLFLIRVARYCYVSKALSDPEDAAGPRGTSELTRVLLPLPCVCPGHTVRPGRGPRRSRQCSQRGSPVTVEAGHF